MSGVFDRRVVRRRFARAADRYAALAVLQREVEARLIERVAEAGLAPAVVLDVGSGPGGGTAALRRQFRGARVVALDLAVPMLRKARAAAGFWRTIPAVCGDAAHLPLRDRSVDLLFSSLCLQWLDDVPAVFAGFARVLRPGGRLFVSTFGPDTLHELRDAWQQADGRAHVSAFAPMAVLGDALMAQGYRDPVLDRDLFTLTYPDVDGLLAELRGIGAANARSDRARGLAGRHAWQRMRDAYGNVRDDEGRYPATYEVIYLQATAPPDGQPRRSDGGEIATIPVSAIKRQPPRR